MSRPYRYLGGGLGEVALPEGMHDRFGDTWVIRRYVWCGDERWAAKRCVPPPPEARTHGVIKQWEGWSDEQRMRDWLNDQNQAMADFERLPTSESDAVSGTTAPP